MVCKSTAVVSAMTASAWAHVTWHALTHLTLHLLNYHSVPDCQPPTRPFCLGSPVVPRRPLRALTAPSGPSRRCPWRPLSLPTAQTPCPARPCWRKLQPSCTTAPLQKPPPRTFLHHLRQPGYCSAPWPPRPLPPARRPLPPPLPLPRDLDLDPPSRTACVPVKVAHSQRRPNALHPAHGRRPLGRSRPLRPQTAAPAASWVQAPGRCTTAWPAATAVAALGRRLPQARPHSSSSCSSSHSCSSQQ